MVGKKENKNQLVSCLIMHDERNMGVQRGLSLVWKPISTNYAK